jgi:predicted membrane channel-forming protein YqfA (hemolysin III family)
MTLSLKARKRWSLVVLLVGLPAYIVVAVSLVSWIDRPSIWLELLIYIVLGFIWILPLKRVFLGVGQPDPDDREE